MANSRPKTFYECRDELIGGLEVIANAIQDYEQCGKVYPLRTVAVQLRALIVRARGSLQYPLLIELANEKSFPLIVYASDPGYLDHITSVARQRPILYSTGDPFSLEKDLIYCLETHLEPALEMRHVTIGNRELTLKQVIRLIADKEAAHYDPTVPEDLDNLSVVGLGGLSAAYRTIYSVGRVVRDLGFQFVAAIL